MTIPDLVIGDQERMVPIFSNCLLYEAWTGPGEAFNRLGECAKGIMGTFATIAFMGMESRVKILYVSRVRKQFRIHLYGLW